MENQENTFDVKEVLKNIEDLGKQNGYVYDDLVYRKHQRWPEPCPNHVCPNCGFCPACGRHSWPQRYPWYEPIWVVTQPDSYTYC